jgi:hypothetical protein
MIIPTIIVATYNRPSSLKRILKSVSLANYINYKDIRLVISIDGGGNNHSETLEVATNFEWRYGEKIIIDREHNIGLRNHIISCGDFSLKYENVIVLEDDLLVSKNFYQYSAESLKYFGSDENIAGISLYSYVYNENSGTVFMPLQDGYDNYFMQVPSSWGQVWTKKQWGDFKTFYNDCPKIKNDDLLPSTINSWSEASWKKYFFLYLVRKNLFFVYPQQAHSTNFADCGTHVQNSINNRLYQVPLEYCTENRKYRLLSFEKSLNKYDVFFELLPDSLIKMGIEIDQDTCIDLEGTKPLSLISHKYLLSSKFCKKPIKTFALDLYPIINNILYNQSVDTTGIFYGEKNTFTEKEQQQISIDNVSRTQRVGYYKSYLYMMSHKYYKLGFYLTNWNEGLKMIMRKIQRKNRIG